MKYGIDCGHNCPPDSGCFKLKREDSLTMAVGKRVIEGLQLLGHEVVDCTPKKANTLRHSLGQRVAIANSSNVDFFVSIHFNCFNTKVRGSEVFAISSAGWKVAHMVLAEICDLGFIRRGVKDGKHLFVVSNTQMPAILVECCFCDNAEDMELFDADKMAIAIIKGLTGKIPPEDQPSLLIP
jgi:N-acetylmuramoyl-L-alanine amidase